MCLQSGGPSPDPSVLRLHELLRSLHSLCAAEPGKFRAAYAEAAAEAVALAAAGRFEGYAPERRGAGPSALHYAAGCGCLEACTALLEHCGRLNFVVDASGQTPLFWAVQSGLRATAALLLRAGADALHADAELRMPLHVAAARGCPRSCELLLGANGVRERGLRGRTAQGWLALHAAAAAGHAEVCGLLLRSGTEAAAVTPQGRTALHLAALDGHAAAAESVLAVCPEVLEAVDAEGMRALDYAEERGWSAVAAVLGSEGAIQRKLRSKWRSYFEPPCRALLNVPACEAFLEICRPHVLAMEHSFLRLSCRVVDTLGLFRSYAVEMEAEAGSAAVHFARCGGQRAIDDVELLVPRRQVPKALWDSGAECDFRVVGLLDAKMAAKAGVEGLSVYSAWAMQACIPSWD